MKREKVTRREFHKAGSLVVAAVATGAAGQGVAAETNGRAGRRRRDEARAENGSPKGPRL